MKLKDLKVRKVETTLLRTEGDFLMNIVRFEEINSFEKNFNHDLKADLKSQQEAGEMWIDPTPQVAITFGSTEGKGVITDRFNLRGFVHADDSDVTDDILKRKDVLVIKGYVCKENKDGLYERIVHEERTEKAINRLYSLLNKFGYTTDDYDVETALKEARDEQIPVVATIQIDDYEGNDNDRYVITKYRAPKEKEVLDEEVPEVTAEEFNN